LAPAAQSDPHPPAALVSPAARWAPRPRLDPAAQSAPHPPAAPESPAAQWDLRPRLDLAAQWDPRPRLDLAALESLESPAAPWVPRDRLGPLLLSPRLPVQWGPESPAARWGPRPPAAPVSPVAQSDPHPPAGPESPAAQSGLHPPVALESPAAQWDPRPRLDLAARWDPHPPAGLVSPAAPWGPRDRLGPLLLSPRLPVQWGLESPVAQSVPSLLLPSPLSPLSGPWRPRGSSNNSSNSLRSRSCAVHSSGNLLRIGSVPRVFRTADNFGSWAFSPVCDMVFPATATITVE